MIRVVLMLSILLFCFTGCGNQAIDPLSYSFSFESGMEGWEVSGTDLGDPPVEWSIERSTDIANDRKTSVRLYLDNMNDAGKIWIERLFDIKPNNRYQVRIEYDLASADWGDMNLWTIITGAMLVPPELNAAYQGNTGNNAAPENGFVWLHKSYDFKVHSGIESELLVIIGVWGTWETARTYYLDNIRVTITDVGEDPGTATIALKTVSKAHVPW